MLRSSQLRSWQIARLVCVFYVKGYGSPLRQVVRVCLLPKKGSRCCIG